MNSHDSRLDRDQLIGLLREVGEVLQSRGLEANLYVVGGAAMAIVFDARRPTRDVDSEIRDQTDAFREAVAEVARRHDLAEDWVNSRATAFMSRRPDVDAAELNLPGLRIAVASPEHLLAMKLRAMRARDLDDLVVLYRHLGITDPEQAVAIHDRLFDDTDVGFYPPGEIHFAAEEVFRYAAGNNIPLHSAPQSNGGQGRHWVQAHVRNGKPVAGHWRANPRRSA